MIMESMENEKKYSNMEITSEYKPISLYKTIMLLMKNKTKIEMESLCNKFPFFLYNKKLLLMGNENHINMETTCNTFQFLCTMP